MFKQLVNIYLLLLLILHFLVCVIHSLILNDFEGKKQLAILKDRLIINTSLC